MPIETFPIGPLETNCHIVISGSDAVAVDPGGDLNSGLGEVLALLKEQNLTLRAILCTHFHFDHLYGVAALHEATGAPVYGPAGDASLLGTELGGSGAWGFPPVTTFQWEDLKEGPHTFGSIKCEVLTTPGHTPGSLSIYFPELNSIMTGDLAAARKPCASRFTRRSSFFRRKPRCIRGTAPTPTWAKNSPTTRTSGSNGTAFLPGPRLRKHIPHLIGEISWLSRETSRKWCSPIPAGWTPPLSSSGFR